MDFFDGPVVQSMVSLTMDYGIQRRFPKSKACSEAWIYFFRNFVGISCSFDFQSFQGFQCNGFVEQ